MKVAFSMLDDASVIKPCHLSGYFMGNYQRLRKEDKHSETSAGITKASNPNSSMDSPEIADFKDLETHPNVQKQGKICLNSTLKSIETQYVQNALMREGYNISKAGRFLNLSPQALQYKIIKLEIHIPLE